MSTAQADWDAKHGQGMTQAELDRPLVTEPEWDAGSLQEAGERAAAFAQAQSKAMTAEQQIRAKALQAATLFTGPTIGTIAKEVSGAKAQEMLWEIVAEFEAYIRDGK